MTRAHNKQGRPFESKPYWLLGGFWGLVVMLFIILPLLFLIPPLGWVVISKTINPFLRFMEPLFGGSSLVSQSNIMFAPDLPSFLGWIIIAIIFSLSGAILGAMIQHAKMADINMHNKNKIN